MDPLWIGVAFVFGFAVRQVGLPPMVGFLVAGFALQAMGVEGGLFVEELADFGVMLLLFSIGLKLRVKTLLRPEIWAGATIHMATTVVVLGVLICGLAATGLMLFADLDLVRSLLVAFALSFSSTVFAVKVLEEKGEMASLHGRVSIGILIMHDLIAFVFLTSSTGKLPSPWAVLLIGLFALRPVLLAIMTRSGHGELLILLGLLLTIFGGASFEVVGLKPDLGALVLGVLMGAHPKADELAKALLGFKDLFLVGFFLSIGLTSTPSLAAVGVAVLLVLAVPFKVALFFLLLTRFKLRARTSLLASLSLANYSEFGLIVDAVAVENGWLSSDWLAIVAIAVSITFVLAAPLNSSAHAIYARLQGRLRRFQSGVRLADDQPVDPGDAEIIVFGMGRVGTGAFDALRERFGDVVVGVDRDSVTVEEHNRAGRKVILGDATDSDFWERATLRTQIRLAMLAMPSHRENIEAARQLTDLGFAGLVAATATFDDEIAALEEEGVDAAFNIYAGAGLGFADHVLQRFDERLAPEGSS